MLHRSLPRMLLLVLMVALTTLTALAYASPPDPTWVSGFFNDDDNDDGVFLITSSAATLDPFPQCCWAPFPVRQPAPVLDDRSPDSTLCFSSADARASPRT